MACLMLNFLNLESLVMINFVMYSWIFFRALIEKVDITQELKMAGNVTIFSPLNEAFDKLPIKIENQNLSSLRRLILRHFVKGFLFKRDMENGTVSINIKYIVQNMLYNSPDLFMFLTFFCQLFDSCWFFSVEKEKSFLLVQ